MRYTQPDEPDRATVADILSGDDTEKICETLVGLALNATDWQWVQELCLNGTRHADGSVRAVSATCLGHIARIHGRLDLSRVLPRLEALRADPLTSGYAENALEDISQCI